MIAFALSSTVLAWALAFLVLCAVLRALYVVGLREQARRASAAQEALQPPSSVDLGGGMPRLAPAEHARREARAVLRERDPARAARADWTDPL